MPNPRYIADGYDAAAEAYAEKFLHELDDKHLDCLLLNAFTQKYAGKGLCADLGCGPGQTTQFLFDAGMTKIMGIDLSAGMVRVARSLHPEINFETGNMLELAFQNEYFASAIAFYSIVHFEPTQLETAFGEINRVLIPRAGFLLSFHIGDDNQYLTDFLGQKVNMEFVFHQTKTIQASLIKAGFEMVDVIERHPYTSEHPSKRAYIWCSKNGNV